MRLEVNYAGRPARDAKLGVNHERCKFIYDPESGACLSGPFSRVAIKPADYMPVMGPANGVKKNLRRLSELDVAGDYGAVLFWSGLVRAEFI
jgi:hypothetical protein